MHLSAELPLRQGGSKRVLYPASARAGSDLQVREFCSMRMVVIS